mmetsp:Transcript_26197/g.57623  ORF Transcript_26197/g.57623 Transcript_26197/m.57623 type:complete len:244 (+) Transcript_26197:50-781(+)
MSGTREENLFMAKLAEHAERYEDMIEYMKRIAGMGGDLTVDERNLFSVAFKNSVGARRQSWRAVRGLEKQAEHSPEVLEVIKDYRKKVGSELNARCADVLAILAKDLIPSSGDTEAKVFYLKMKGDYHRYMAEFADGQDHSRFAQEAQEAYQGATEAAASMPACHPVRLGLALNFSVFFYEVLASPEQACVHAKAAYEAALTGEASSEAEQILQLLNDNLFLWTKAEDGKTGVDQDGTAVEEF